MPGITNPIGSVAIQFLFKVVMYIFFLLNTRYSYLYYSDFCLLIAFCFFKRHNMARHGGTHYNPSYSGQARVGELQSEADPGKKHKTLPEK
jgi:hypothetical protein